jgi:hypothetical protein
MRGVSVCLTLLAALLLDGPAAAQQRLRIPPALLERSAPIPMAEFGPLRGSQDAATGKAPADTVFAQDAGARKATGKKASAGRTTGPVALARNAPAAGRSGLSRNGTSGNGAAENGSSAKRGPADRTSSDGSAKSAASKDDESDDDDNGAATRKPRTAKADGDTSTNDDDETDTSDIFGFTEGSDTSEKGTRILFHDVLARSGRHESFGGLRSSIGVAYSPSDRLQVWIAPWADYEGQSGDPLADELRGSVGYGLSGGAKYQLLERSKTRRYGVAVQVAPFWLRSTPLTGGENDLYGAEFRLIADYEIIAKQLYGALNLIYRPETHSSTLEGTSSSSAVHLTAAVSSPITDDIYVGAEVRYLTHFDSAFLDRYAGWAVFAGPTVYISLSEDAYIGAGWSVQVAGRASADPSVGLDFVNFERHQIHIKSGIVF